MDVDHALTLALLASTLLASCGSSESGYPGDSCQTGEKVPCTTASVDLPVLSDANARVTWDGVPLPFHDPPIRGVEKASPVGCSFDPFGPPLTTPFDSTIFPFVWWPGARPTLRCKLPDGRLVEAEIVERPLWGNRADIRQADPAILLFGWLATTRETSNQGPRLGPFQGALEIDADYAGSAAGLPDLVTRDFRRTVTYEMKAAAEFPLSLHARFTIDHSWFHAHSTHRCNKSCGL